MTDPATPPSVINNAPIAIAGSNQNVLMGETVTLDASASSDADKDPLSYLWQLSSKPNGSAAALSSLTAVRPTFVADLPGSYTAQLIVNDGKLDSAVASVHIVAAAGNAAPIAQLREITEVNVGSTVFLDGRASTDANGDPLSYAWVLLSRPTGSRAQIIEQNTAQPTFIADAAGTYTVQLVVSDGQTNSSPAQLVITATQKNLAPLANAGTDQNVATHALVELDGSGSSDPDGNPLTYQWSMTTVPAGSKAQLSSNTSPRSGFVADKPGEYVASLVVNDGMQDSKPATVTIVAADTGITLYSMSGLFSSAENPESWPYSTNSVHNGSSVCSGSGCASTYEVATYKLVAQGRDFTITNLSAVNLATGSPVAASFDGLRNNQVISAGRSVKFSLRSSFTRNETVSLRYSFTIKETGDTFTYDVALRTN
ncbi:hypothetical protein EII18_09720 [Comamonadaceae bacterium OH3737_COT-264]|nr:hypothetical protein EII18_09720 [Comamonadaceae bacterium OH3737_COT-264]